MYLKLTLVASLCIAIGLGIYYGLGKVFEEGNLWAVVKLLWAVMISPVYMIFIFPVAVIITCIPYIILMLIMRLARLNRPIWYVVCSFLAANVFPTYAMFTQSEGAIALGIIIYLSAFIVGIKMHDMDFINQNKAPALAPIYRWFREV
ncbi:MAG: hypothetical protein MK137_08445 [Rickettsiales bacterium]|nr:hypothetical protein [Rickettsiales bacterium]